MYKQALRELYKRWRGLKEAYNSKQLLQVDIDELELEVGCEYSYNDRFRARRDNLNLSKKRSDMAEANKMIAETEREFQRFYQQACALKAEIGELTDEKRQQLDIDMWAYKIREMAALDYLSTGRISKNVIELIMCLPAAMKQDILLEIKEPDKLIEWIENINFEFPQLKDQDNINIINLLGE